MDNTEDIDKNSQSRRWVFTINNPFGDDIEEIDINNTTLPLKEDYYSESAILELEKSDCFKFKYVKISINKDDFEKEDVIVRRPFFKNMESAETYFENLEHRKYCVFQYEQGEEGTKHFQGLIIFSIGKRFKTIRDYMPFAHLEKCKGSNRQARDYCTKKETRIEGPFEIGQFAEERQRTDYKDFIDLVQSGMSKQEISKLYPMLYVKEHNKINSIRADMYEEYFKKYRDVEVTFIYGSAGTGKSTYISTLYTPDEAFDVTTIDNSMFTNYDYQDVLVLDEFSGGMKVGTFNRMCDFKPFDLRGLGCAKPSCFHKVFIISNYSLPQIIKRMCGDDYQLYKTIDRRIHRIIHFTGLGKYKVERDCEWTDETNEKLIACGLTKRIKYIYNICDDGTKNYIFNTCEIPDLQPVEIDDDVFGDVQLNF